MSRSRPRRRRSVLLGTVLVAGAWVAVGVLAPPDDGIADDVAAAPGPSAVASSPSSDGPQPTSSATPAAAAAAADLAVKGRAPRTGYDRDLFGPAWADVDRNGCDTRNDVLRRDLAAVVTKDGTHGCVVLTGVLDDPYTGETIPFERGQGTSALVQIDHVVALADAWQKGAQQWSPETRRQFANDPLNLIATQGTANQAKGAGDTATWLPPNKTFRCAYVAQQVAVKRAYGLWVTAAEQEAMIRVLSACPDEPLPDGGPTAVPAPTAELPAPVAPASGTAPATPGTAPAGPTAAAAVDPGPPPGGVYYENCATARAAGAAPLRVGDPGYRERMDGDRDGVACE